MLSHCEILPYSSTQSLQCIWWHARSPKCPLLSRRGSSVSLGANVSRLQSACAYSSETSSASIACQQQGRHGLQETCRQPAHAKMVACLAAAVVAVAGVAPSPAWAEKKEVRLRDVENPVLQSGKGSLTGLLRTAWQSYSCLLCGNCFQVQLCLEVLGLVLARAAAAAVDCYQLHVVRECICLGSAAAGSVHTLCAWPGQKVCWAQPAWALPLPAVCFVLG